MGLSEDWRCQEQIDKLISEFVNDLKDIIAELDCMARTRASRKIEKWEEKL